MPHVCGKPIGKWESHRKNQRTMEVYPLVKVHIAMEKHYFSRVNPLSIAKFNSHVVGLMGGACLAGDLAVDRVLTDRGFSMD